MQAFKFLWLYNFLVEDLRSVVESSVEGRAFVHCAQGHGRTGLFALALLLRRGSVQTIEDGVGLLRRLRPAVRLNREQVEFAHRYLKTNAEQAMDVNRP